MVDSARAMSSRTTAPRPRRWTRSVWSGATARSPISRGSGTAGYTDRRVWYRDTRPEERQDQLDGTTLLLDTRCGRNCSVSYTVIVPAQVNVTGHLDTGPID